MLTQEKSLHLPHSGARGLAVTIVGAGMMGHALAAIFAAAGSGVTLCETDSTALASAKQRLRTTLQAAELDPNAADAIRLVNSLDALDRSEEHTSELQSLRHLVCRLLLE